MQTQKTFLKLFSNLLLKQEHSMRCWTTARHNVTLQTSQTSRVWKTINVPQTVCASVIFPGVTLHRSEKYLHIVLQPWSRLLPASHPVSNLDTCRLQFILTRKKISLKTTTITPLWAVKSLKWTSVTLNGFNSQKALQQKVSEMIHALDCTKTIIQLLHMWNRRSEPNVVLGPRADASADPSSFKNTDKAHFKRCGVHNKHARADSWVAMEIFGLGGQIWNEEMKSELA